VQWTSGERERERVVSKGVGRTGWCRGLVYSGLYFGLVVVCSGVVEMLSGSSSLKRS